MIIRLDECESTHGVMREKVAELPDWAVVVAEFQSGGRGRHGRAWVAPKGKNLCFNVLLPAKNLEPELYAPTTQIAAITLAKMLRKKGIDADVKWPNDILVNKHKICGMISEFICDRISLGIGLNVNTEKSDFTELDRLATSMFIEKGEVFDRETVLQEFLTEFKTNFELLHKKGLRPFIEDWRRMGCFVGCSGVIDGCKGVIEGVQDDGSLLFRTENGLKTIWSGDLEI